MKISVIIPTHRPRSYLWECLDSLKIQTFPKDDFEIILVINGCNEPYHSQIEGYLSLNMSDNIVNFIHLDQGGVSNARNVALNCARGEYIAFVDDDDFVSPSYLTELYGLAKPDTIPLCYPYAFVDGSIKQIKYPSTTLYDDRHNKGKQSYRYARKYFSGPWMKLIPKSYIQERRFDVRFKNGEDALFNFLISFVKLLLLIFSILKQNSPDTYLLARRKCSLAYTEAVLRTWLSIRLRWSAWSYGSRRLFFALVQ